MTETTPPYRYLDADSFCLSARLLPDLNTGGVTDTLSITIEGSDEPQSVHVPAADAPAVAAGIVAAAGQQAAATVPAPAPTDPAERRTRYASAMARRDGDTWPTTYENDEADYLRRADAAISVADAEQAEPLSEAERTMLGYALDQAQERIWSEDGFTDEDQAAVTSLRRLTALPSQEPTP